MFHRSVLLHECIEGLAVKPGGVYVDATYGGGGHSAEILKVLKGGRLIVFDQDEDAMTNRIDDDRLIMINSNFRYLRNFLKLYKAIPVDGILADLGISSHQIDNPERGFSTRFEGTLDMRMNRMRKLSAKEVVNQYDEERLASILFQYGEIKNAARISKLIVSARKTKEILTTKDLKEILNPAAEKGRENKFLARIFQALRIEVNQELESLKDFLLQASEVLRTNGRIVVVCYHSLEDKLVKEYFRSGNFSGKIEKDFYGNPLVPLKVINKKPIVPGEEEIISNNRARSARLRIAEKI